MKYKPLDDSRNEIRVLRFLGLSKSRSRDDPIQCSIENVPLDESRLMQHFHGHVQNQQQRQVCWDPYTKDVDLRDSTLEQTTLDSSITLGLIRNHDQPGASRYTWGDFEALSYTWGDGDDTSKVMLNGVCKEVSKNLDNALRTLQDLPETSLGMRYWVDSLCIDQQNIDERNHQVKRMKDIYSKARAVIVWLGREEEADRDAVQAMRHLCRHPDVENPLWLPPELRFNGWFALCAFMRKPYWNRSWIIQELAVNHNSTLVLCGRLKLTRRMIRLGADFCQKLVRATGDQYRQSNGYPGSDVWSIASRIYRVVSLTSDPHLGRSLDKLLNLVRRSDATDKKDKIYGILGLVDTAVSSKIFPDYSLSEQQVYTKFMISLVSTTQRLEQIIFGGVSVEEGWPSWVPDWRLAFERKHIRYLRSRQASGDLPASIQFSKNGKNDLLICSGFTVDMVDGVGAGPSLSSGFTQPNKASNQYGSNLPDALWRTLLMDHPGAFGKSLLLCAPWTTNSDSTTGPSSPHRRPQKSNLFNTDYFHKFNEFREVNEEFRIGGRRFRDFFLQSSWEGMDLTYMLYHMRLAVLSLNERSLITTINGYLGLAPKAVRQGDVVVILPGCRCPTILRPCGKFYKVVGECYIHGLMDGEFFNPDDREIIVQQEFTLC